MMATDAPRVVSDGILANRRVDADGQGYYQADERLP